MFEVPAAKRIKRSELSNDDTEKSVETDAQSTGVVAAVPDYGFEYDFVEAKPGTTQTEQHENSAKAEEQVFQFNLFRPSTKPKPTTQAQSHQTSTAQEQQREKQLAPPVLISIRSPSPEPEVDINTTTYTNIRPDSHYFTSCLPNGKLRKLRESYEQAAMSTSQIEILKRTTWPGTNLPWRVLHLPAHRKQVVQHKVTHGDESTKSMGTVLEHNDSNRVHRARPSKKKRDLLKDRATKRQQIIDESKTKEEHEREKKNKKNRERKLKRRAKERKEKEEKSTNVQDDGSNQVDEDVSS